MPGLGSGGVGLWDGEQHTEMGAPGKQPGGEPELPPLRQRDLDPAGVQAGAGGCRRDHPLAQGCSGEGLRAEDKDSGPVPGAGPQHPSCRLGPWSEGPLLSPVSSQAPAPSQPLPTPIMVGAPWTPQFSTLSFFSWILLRPDPPNLCGGSCI